MIAEQVENSDGIVSGTIIVCHVAASILFESITLHSFISYAFETWHNISYEKLNIIRK